MLNNILLCTDGSEHSRAAAAYAALIAKAVDGNIEVLHVMDNRLLEGPYLADFGGALGVQPYQALVPQMQTILREKASILLEATRAFLEKEGARSSGSIKSGALVAEILEAEAAHDLVVIGKRGENAPHSDDRIGSSVEWLARRSVKPCLVAPATFAPLRRVVAAFDGSTHAEKALMKAIGVVKALKLPLTILTVVPVVSEEEKWREVLNEGIALIRSLGHQAESVLLHGHPDEKIVEYCEASEGDLLVIGAYGQGRIREFLLGSTTFQILLKTAVPVFLIR